MDLLMIEFNLRERFGKKIQLSADRNEKKVAPPSVGGAYVFILLLQRFQCSLCRQEVVRHWNARIRRGDRGTG